MQRLVTFGCSVTYGHGLPDCHVPPNDPGPLPSAYAWPNLVASYFNIPVSNQGVCGNSNLAILQDILKFKFAKDDIVVVMWSFVGRDLIFGRKGFVGNQELIPVGTWQETELAKNWMLTHSHEDIATRTWFYMHHALCYLKMIGVPVYNVFAGYNELKRYKPKFLNLEFYKIKTQAMTPIDRALDNMHPGIRTHEAIAKELIGIINEHRH